MKAVERVLGDVYKLEELDPRLRRSADKLKEEFKEVRSCCCFDGFIVAPDTHPKPDYEPGKGSTKTKPKGSRTRSRR